MSKKKPVDKEAEYWDWLHGGRERASIARRKGERLATILWCTSAGFLILALVLHTIGLIVR
jgi:hypothetical protein